MRGGSMGGSGPLPFSGGYADQPAGLMKRLRFVLGLHLRLEQERSAAERRRR